MHDLGRGTAKATATLAMLAMLSTNLSAGTAGSAGPAIEVFHYLDTPADTHRVNVLRDALTSTGHTWKDFTVANGWTGWSESILQFRVASRNPPMAAMMKAPLTQHWAASGALLPLDDIASEYHWDVLLPKAIADTVKYRGRYYAVPLNIHRVNWLWINERILRESGAAVPANWDEFFVTAEAMKRAGYAAVAYYGRPTQNLLLFEMIALSIGGSAFHRKALVEYDAAALNGPVMVTVLRTYRRIKRYTEQPADARISIERGNSMFQTGKVGMHLMGDWANPAFHSGENAAPFKALCVPVPGSGNNFLFTSDSIALFRRPDAAPVKGQLAFAAAIMSASVQRDYNLFKGSIPARQDADFSRFDGCALKTAAAFRDAARANTLSPAISMTASREIEDGIQGIITEFWNNDRMSPQQAMSRLVAATRRR
ncbi:ABC transporter substrate-binding protein [Massilia sp. HP4]|uniref:ABC transporter substrate-binding protein n=1 Tax=Massilia sp. HP4 TaxID=2562316 RepID=UPI0010C0376B|nr:ABC transporter substrate-binding protein [Massilia sp. HP4]